MHPPSIMLCSFIEALSVSVAPLGSRSGRDLLVGKLGNVGSLAGVLNGDPGDIAVVVKVKDRVLIKVLGFRNLDSAKLNV